MVGSCGAKMMSGLSSPQPRARQFVGVMLKYFTFFHFHTFIKKDLKGKGERYVLGASAVASPLDRSKRFTLPLP